MTHLDDEITRGTFETGSFGARFNICFDREQRESPVCCAIGARTERELYVARCVAGQASTAEDDLQRIATQDSWAATLKNLRWLRGQSPYALRIWLREKGFEPFIDEYIASARARAAL